MLLKGAGIKYRTEKHAAVFTVAESIAHSPGAAPVKNLLLTEEKGSRVILVVMRGDERLDMKTLAKQVGCKKLRFAKPDVMMEKIAVTPGSASLFCLLHDGSKDVEVVVDRQLTLLPEVGFHPLINTSTVYIGGGDIILFLKAIGRSFTLI